MEVTPGTPVAATKIMQSIMIQPKLGSQGQTAIPQGGKFPVGQATTEQWTDWAMTLNTPSFGELCYLYASAMGLPTPTPVGSNGVELWTFGQNQLTTDARQAFTIEHGSAVRGRQASSAYVNQLQLKFSRKSISGSGSMVAQTMTDPFALTALTPVADVQTITTTGVPTGGTFTLGFRGQVTTAIPYNATAIAVQNALNALTSINGAVTCTGGPLPTGVVVTFSGMGGAQPVLTHTDSFTGGATPAAAIAHTTPGVAIYPEYPLYPLQSAQTNLYIDSSAASLGTTQMNRAFSADVTLGNLISTVFAMNSSASFSGIVETENQDPLTLVVEADSAGSAYLAQFTAGTSMFVRVQTLGKTIDGTNAYQHTLDACIKFDKAPSYTTSDGVECIQYPGRIFFDPSWGKALSIGVQNLLPSL
jgi:hypothetical protein